MPAVVKPTAMGANNDVPLQTLGDDKPKTPRLAG
jgi:hypothetical protein